MATVSRNPMVRTTNDQYLAGIPIVPGQAINQGDIVMWDSSLNSGNGGLRVAANQADMATYMGVSEQQSPFASLGDTFNTIKVQRGGIVKLKTTAAETYTMFQTVYFNETLDAQSITNGTNTGARTVAVGVIIIPQSAAMNGVTSVAGGAGIEIHVWLTPKFPLLTI